MKIARRSEAREFKNGATCVAFEYPLHDANINIAVVKIAGRYPEEGRAANQTCKEVVYVMEGKITLNLKGKEVLLQKGDTVLIEPGELFYWEGNATLVMPCTPPWTPEQYKKVD
jgi:mannose-6-phosphate isomerase-like protein (cupin superfamily)